MKNRKPKIVKNPFLLILLSPFQKMRKRLESPIKRKPGIRKSINKPAPISNSQGSLFALILKAPFRKKTKRTREPIKISKRKIFKEALIHSAKIKNEKKDKLKVASSFFQFLKYWSSTKAEYNRTMGFKKSVEKKSFLVWLFSFRINTLKSYINQSIVSFGNWFEHSKNLLQRKITRVKLISLALNSTFLYIISYLITYVLYQLSTIIVGSHFGLFCKLYYHSIIWPPSSSKLWNFDSVIMTFVSGPIFSLFIAVLFLILFLLIHEKSRIIKIFFLWGYLHAFNFFLSSFLAGAISEKGIGYALDWMYFSTVEKIIASILGTFILAFIGLASTNNFFKTAPSNFYLEKENRLLYIIFVVVIPWFIGSLFILLLKIPNNTPYETLLFIPLVFAFIPIFPSSNSKYFYRVRIQTENKKIFINWRLFTFFIIVMLLFRVGLGIGIRFDF
ncbi:MAG: hypothetical protein WCH34_04660 [Bacteroidota bacterium]